MTITDILWPWGALREARAEAAAATAQALQSAARAEQLRADLDAEHRRNRYLKERNNKLSRSLIHLHDVLMHSHFRDPATGRIGKIGEYPRVPE